MRTEGQIRYQLKQVTFRHLQRRLRENFRKRPESCAHNQEVVLDEKTGATVGLCGILSPEGVPRNVPCDSRLAGCSEMARDCPLWAPLQTRDEVKTEFHKILQSGDRGVIAASYPDIAALLWVLDTDPPTEAEVDAQAETPEEPHISFWGVIKKIMRD